MGGARIVNRSVTCLPACLLAPPEDPLTAHLVVFSHAAPPHTFLCSLCDGTVGLFGGAAKGKAVRGQAGCAGLLHNHVETAPNLDNPQPARPPPPRPCHKCCSSRPTSQRTCAHCLQGT